MQDDPNQKDDRQREMATADAVADGTRVVGDAIRQAFLTHMGEQQRQFPGSPVAERRQSGGDPKRR